MAWFWTTKAMVAFPAGSLNVAWLSVMLPSRRHGKRKEPCPSTHTSISSGSARLTVLLNRTTGYALYCGQMTGV